MANENIFSTPKENTPSPANALKAMTQRRALQAQNRQALAEAKALERTLADGASIMETALAQSAKDAQRAATLENMAHQQGTRNVARGQIGLRQRIIRVGLIETRKKVLEELVYEAYWLDDAVKECTADQITDSIDNVMSYIDENFHGARVAESEYSPLLKNVSAVIEGVVEKAADRIYNAALESGEVDPEFELTDSEEEELDNKLGDLGRDEIVDLIRNKVASVVQDEKEKGQERAEMFKALDGEINSDGENPEGTDTEPTEGDGEVSAEEGTVVRNVDHCDINITCNCDDHEDDDDPMFQMTPAAESTFEDIMSGLVVTEGANWDTLKIYFSGLRKRASKMCKEGNKLYKDGKYSEAAKKFDECKDIFEDVQKRLVDVNDSIGATVISYFASFFTMFIPFVDAINTKGGASNLDLVDAYKDSTSWNQTKQYTIANCKKMIKYCEVMSKSCKNKGKSGGNNYKYSLESALTATATDVGYTSGEKNFAKMMENGQELHLVAEDPTWNDFKVCISMLSKKARDLILKGRSGCPECYWYAKDVMAELMKQISTANETVPVDVKQFVLASVIMIFAPIPSDEAIISRFGVSLGSPETQSASTEINWKTVSWADIMANIKTNLTSASDWCANKGDTEYKVIDNDKLNGSACPVSGKSSLAQKVATKQNQLLNQNIGGTLFEALTINAMQNCKTSAMESGMNVSEEDTEDAALVEALLHYTIFETLDTVGLYKFRIGDMGRLQKTLVRSVTEGTSPFETDKDKNGLKKVRINTKKMKQKKDINGKRTTDKVAEM